MASILPIVVVFILRITGLSSPHVDYEPGSPMKRVETNASTHPMMVRNTVEITFQCFSFHIRILFPGIF